MATKYTITNNGVTKTFKTLKAARVCAKVLYEIMGRPIIIKKEPATKAP